MLSYHPKLIEQMIEQTPRALIGLILVSAIYFWAYAAYVPIEYLISWTFLQGIFILFRWKNVKTLEKYIKKNETTKIKKHIKYFFMYMILSALSWNIATILGLLFAPAPYELLTLLMVIGIAMGGVFSLGSLYTIYITYFGIMMLPQLFIMLNYADRIHLSVAGFILVYIPLIFILTKSIYKNLLENILVNESLQSTVGKLHTLSITDPLTHTYTRRYFFDTAKSSMILSMRNNTPLSLLMIDIDYFKKVNDSYGHQGGDTVLIDFVKELQSLIRQSDVLARMGGEEFAILLHNTSNEDALIIAQKIRQSIEETVFMYGEIKISITVSIGTAQLAKNSTSIEALYKEADDNLYIAKKNGRNKVN